SEGEPGEVEDTYAKTHGTTEPSHTSRPQEQQQDEQDYSFLYQQQQQYEEQNPPPEGAEQYVTHEEYDPFAATDYSVSEGPTATAVPPGPTRAESYYTAAGSYQPSTGMPRPPTAAGYSLSIPSFGYEAQTADSNSKSPDSRPAH